ncbi:DNA-binding NarL/FixJ family response regulator [Algoriphagus sp. 4150]|uniref:response regulator transcription factor n=1 Tax=Algoriphagus sp. 4150 TaxID=2817756 RepID=UPI002866C631|nr:response regulator transcription factor [Algoriphagus sp. 4150]MDR7128817.1 DNA-binding NarL/FixJ family response regulator [Algoriphagus sp. 4150]
MKESYNIIIADDHVMFLDGLHNILTEIPQINTIHVATDGLQVLRILSHFDNIDLVISDINMPKMNGLELLSKVKETRPEIKFFLLSMLDDIRTINNAIRKQADGYLLKFADKEELKAGIAEVLLGQQYFSPAVKTKYMEGVFNNKANQEVKLSKREKEILKLLADELTSNEVAEKLFISINTVETHRKNILLKTGSKTTIGAVKFAIENGYFD